MASIRKWKQMTKSDVHKATATSDKTSKKNIGLKFKEKIQQPPEVFQAKTKQNKQTHTHRKGKMLYRTRNRWIKMICHMKEIYYKVKIVKLSNK